MTDNGTVTRRGFLSGAAGTAALVGASGTTVAQDGGGTVEVALVDYAFEPGTNDPLIIPPGTTVSFVWETSNHNIVVDSKPGESDWEGHEPIENEGFTHEHAFEATGDYEYFCQPHRGLGMEAVITVEEGAPVPGQDGGGEGGGAPAIPDAAKTLGVGLFAAMLVTLGLAYSLLKYGGSPDDAAE